MRLVKLLGEFTRNHRSSTNEYAHTHPHPHTHPLTLTHPLLRKICFSSGGTMCVCALTWDTAVSLCERSVSQQTCALAALPLCQHLWFPNLLLVKDGKKKKKIFFWYRLCESKHTRKTFFKIIFYIFSSYKHKFLKAFTNKDLWSFASEVMGPIRL